MKFQDINSLRNTVIALAALALMGWLGWIAGTEHITDMTGTYSAVGTSTAAIIGARAVNKWVEANNGKNPEGD